VEFGTHPQSDDEMKGGIPMPLLAALVVCCDLSRPRHYVVRSEQVLVLLEAVLVVARSVPPWAFLP